jgi:hypothetical protein
MIIDYIYIVMSKHILMLAPTITAMNSEHLSRVNLGTGNVLFQVATTYGLSKTYSRTPDFSYLQKYCDKIRSLFHYDHGDTLYRNCRAAPPTKYSYLVGENAREKTYSFSAIQNIVSNPGVNILLEGYFEYPPYFNEYREDILAMFAPDAKSQLSIDTMYPELKTENVIAVHIRTGKDANVRSTMEYYKRAISYMNERVSDPIYFVFSDGPVDIDNLGVRVRYIRGNFDYIDLWTMSQCKHNIITYSTFSWWGAYLNRSPEKIVTYPSSAMVYIRAQNGESESTLHTNYFLSAVQIVDTD